MQLAATCATGRHLPTSVPRAARPRCARARCAHLRYERQRAQLPARRLPHDVEALAVAAKGRRVLEHPADARVHVLQHVQRIALQGGGRAAQVLHFRGAVAFWVGGGARCAVGAARPLHRSAPHTC